MTDAKFSTITRQGRLKKNYCPAIYFDASVIVDYWLTEGMEIPPNEHQAIIAQNELPHLKVARDLLRSDLRLSKIIEIRKLLMYEDVKATAVVTPLAIFELIEWYAEASIKNVAAEAVGVLGIQKKSKKDIGSLLAKLYDLAEEEQSKKKKADKRETSGIELLISETMLNPSFAIAHGFAGLMLVDIKNFNVHSEVPFMHPFLYAYLQMGLADIMHIMMARHLGCQYIASFDVDFTRVKKHVESSLGISILSTPDSILDVLKGDK